MDDLRQRKAARVRLVRVTKAEGDDAHSSGGTTASDLAPPGALRSDEKDEIRARLIEFMRARPPTAGKTGEAEH